MFFYKVFLNRMHDGIFEGKKGHSFFTAQEQKDFTETNILVFTCDIPENLPKMPKGKLFDLPFKNCWLEISAASNGYVLKDISKNHGFTNSRVAGIHIIEVIGGYKITFMPIKQDRGVLQHAVGRALSWESEIGDLTYYLLSQIEKCKIGEASPRTSINIKLNGIKQTHRISKVIYITPKNKTKEISDKEGHPINWTHRFWRRGHWMHFWTDQNKNELNLKKIGKDRSGEYVEQGRTWVIEAIIHKDKEHLPLINKLRVVKEEG